MTPTITTLKEKKLIGMHRTMSFANYTIGELWQKFMPARHQITNTLNKDLISMVIYGHNHFEDFKPTNEFERWSAVEVSDFDQVPVGMEEFVLEAGLYAVFNYKGNGNDPAIFQYIFGTWLPASAYHLDNRPHFEVLGDKYKNNDPESEEEIWIPVKLKF
jgi:AraC family transcriptional regulator